MQQKRDGDDAGDYGNATRDRALVPVTLEATPLVDHALRYARLGWWVFPLHTADGEKCSCRQAGCENQGKHPRTAHGFVDASRDEAQIERWWGMWPTANIGIATGASGLVVIDVDPKNGGDYKALEERFTPDALDTVTGDTGGGGYHLVYRCPPGVRLGNVNNSPRFTGPLGPGIDVRAWGGYIVVPPSNHKSGYLYDWEVDLSPWDRQPALLPDALMDILAGPPPKREDDRELLDVSSILAGVPEGERDWQLFLLSAKLRGADVPLEWAYRLVEDAAARCTPPLPADYARQKVDSAYRRYEAGRTAIVDPGDDRHSDGLAGRILLDTSIHAGVPEPEWLIPQLLVRGYIHLVYGEPESGKTVLSTRWMLDAISNGHAVLFVDEESGQATIASFLAAMGAEEVDRLLHYFPFPSLDLADADALISYAAELQPALVVFDSLTDMLANAGLDENSGAEVTKWMKVVAERLARAPYKPAVVLVDHVTKDTQNTKYSVASRAKKAKSDVLWLVEKLSDFDQTKTANVVLHRHKNRPGVLPPKVPMVVGGREGRLVVEPFDISHHGISRLSEAHHKILQALGDEALQTSEIVGRTGLGLSWVKVKISELLAMKMLECEGTGRNSKYRAHLATTGQSPATLAGQDEELSASRNGLPPTGVPGLADGDPDLPIDPRAPHIKAPWWLKEGDDD